MTLENPEPSDDQLDPVGSTDLIAAALRSDAAEVDTLVRVLTATLGDALPPGLVEVERSRSFGDRLSGRDGTPVAVTVSAGDLQLRLSHAKGRGGPVRAERQRVVRGVVISREEIGIDAWVATLAAVLRDLAARNAAARDALARMLGA
ncbi:hypothetical protein FHX74_001521 [Friedmanniella endophytica]|uniref:Uncharacterized protein n=1 Tax=Microlunatus kandeliicorticis TaxID=1759536 RepID=A0A7W3IRH1_9ACTN|nr:hypothetical protein [Microlunatus kandeliicorticis]MBA8793916.1 hypothetical protein [Microlunatus kandeliicorticis]